MNTAAMTPCEATRATWQPMQLRYVGHVGDVMRGTTGTRRDTQGPGCNVTGATSRPC